MMIPFLYDADEECDDDDQDCDNYDDCHHACNDYAPWPQELLGFEESIPAFSQTKRFQPFRDFDDNDDGDYGP